MNPDGSAQICKDILLELFNALALIDDGVDRGVDVRAAVGVNFAAVTGAEILSFGLASRELKYSKQIFVLKFLRQNMC